MKKTTLATTLLIALTSLGLATTANAAEVTGTTKATVSVSEGTSTIALNGVENASFGFNEIGMNEEGKLINSFEKTSPLTADIINKTFGDKQYSLTVNTDGINSAGITAELDSKQTIKQAEQGSLNGALTIKLDATKYEKPADGQDNTLEVVLSETTAPVTPPTDGE